MDPILILAPFQRFIPSSVKSRAKKKPDPKEIRLNYRV